MFLNSGKIIYRTLRDLVDNRVFPIIDLSGDVQFPFIVYSKDSSTRSATKDDPYGQTWNHSMTARVVSDSYDEVIELAEKVVDKLDRTVDTVVDGVEIVSVDGFEVTEDYAENSFIVDVSFVLSVNK